MSRHLGVVGLLMTRRHLGVTELVEPGQLVERRNTSLLPLSGLRVDGVTGNAPAALDHGGESGRHDIAKGTGGGPCVLAQHVGDAGSGDPALAAFFPAAFSDHEQCSESALREASSGPDLPRVVHYLTHEHTGHPRPSSPTTSVI
jgi:hypothetical protein